MGEYDAGYENYIDGLHREIIDYQIEVEQAKVENDKLVMKLNAEHLVRQNVERENAKLRELVRDMWNEGMCECGSRGKCARCEYGYPDRMRELGVDV